MAPAMMEGIEEANREAVQSCHRVLDLLSNPHGQLVSNTDLVAATGEAVSMFESLTSKLDNGNGRQGHARVRKVKKPLPIIDSNLFLEGPAVAKTPSPMTSLQRFPRTRPSIPAQFLKRLQLESRAVDLEVPSQTPPVKLVLPGSVAPLAGMPPLALPAVHLHFIQQHQSYQRFIQQMKIQSKTMMKRSNLGYQGQGGSGSAAGGKGAANLKVGGTNCAASSSRSFLSSMSLEGSPASLDGTTRPLQLGTISQTPSTPELGAQTKTKCMGREDGSGRCATLCHCANKKRKLTIRKIIRLPAISDMPVDNPADEFSWRKYGQKPIMGSPHPRGYYRCSTVKDCPARKHVERCIDDPLMVLVTYEGDHNHNQVLAQPAA